MPAPERSLVRVPPYQTLEAWRGFAALWVVLLHSLCLRIAEYGPVLKSNPFYSILLKGQLGVGLFFVISGYCIANAAVSALSRSNTILSFLRARARRIYPPYYMSIALWVAATAFRGLLGGWDTGGSQESFFGRDPLYYLSTFTLTQLAVGRTPLVIIYWSLCYEVAFYAIVAVGLTLSLRRRDPVPMLYGLHGLTAITIGLGLAGIGEGQFPVDLWPQFGLGVLVYHIAAAPASRAPRLLLALMTPAFLVYAARHLAEKDPYHPSPGLWSATALAFAIALVLLQPLDGRARGYRLVRWLTWVGTFSYSLYLTHLPVVGAVNLVLRRLGWPAQDISLRLMPQAIAAVLFARLFYQFAEKPFLSARAPRPASGSLDMSAPVGCDLPPTSPTPTSA
jgi:exopolysaccharide production protein ExoZ